MANIFNKIIQSIRKHAEKYKQNSIATHCALIAFRDRYPDRHIAWVCTPERISHSVHAITVCYGSTRPPSRSWWRVDVDPLQVIELDFEEAKKIIVIREWR